MARARALRKQDLRELGRKALVAEFGVANATRFVMELHEAKQDYSKPRGTLFAEKPLDELYAEIRGTQRRHGRAGVGPLASDATPLNLIVASVKQTAARCRVLETSEPITLRTTGLWRLVPGEIVVVQPQKRWTYAKNAYLSGEIIASRIDVPALGLTPLRLEGHGVWDPNEEYWGEEDEPLPEWALPIVARGPRREYEMEQVLPGDDPDDPDGDPIIQSNDLKDQRDFASARKILMQLLDADLRCLDAHVHLGNLIFDSRPEDAIKHYEIGELSLGTGAPSPQS